MKYTYVLLWKSGEKHFYHKKNAIEFANKLKKSGKKLDRLLKFKRGEPIIIYDYMR